MARRIRGQLIDGLLDILEEPVAGLDRSGAVQFASDRFREFYPAIADGEVFWECLESDPLVRWVSDSLDSTTPDVREQVMAHRPEVLWLARLDPVMGEVGRCAGWVLRLKDIQPVERLSQRLDTLVGEVRRRLRDPLAAMKSRLEVLLEGGHQDRDLTLELLRQINDDSNQLARLLFSLENPEEDVAPPLKDEGTPVPPVLDKVFRTFEPLARAKNLALKQEVANDLDILSTLADGELERCLVNLIDNAVKYTALNGYGEVTVRARGHVEEGKVGVLISVDDSGPGIPEDKREAVFEQFYRLTEGPTAQLGGTGLGLWRVHEVAQKRGGRAYVETAPQGGAGLRLFLPYR
jgi:signal transduction histidine kinase